MSNQLSLFSENLAQGLPRIQQTINNKIADYNADGWVLVSATQTHIEEDLVIGLYFANDD